MTLELQKSLRNKIGGVINIPFFLSLIFAYQKSQSLGSKLHLWTAAWRWLRGCINARWLKMQITHFCASPHSPLCVYYPPTVLVWYQRYLQFLPPPKANHINPLKDTCFIEARLCSLPQSSPECNQRVAPSHWLGLYSRRERLWRPGLAPAWPINTGPGQLFEIIVLTIIRIISPSALIIIIIVLMIAWDGRKLKLSSLTVTFAQTKHFVSGLHEYYIHVKNKRTYVLAELDRVTGGT